VDFPDPSEWHPSTISINYLAFLRVRCFVCGGGRENWSFFVRAKNPVDARREVVLAFFTSRDFSSLNATHATGRKNLEIPGLRSLIVSYVGISTFVHFRGESEKKHPNHGGRRRTMAAMVTHPRIRGVETSANMSYNKAASLKLEHTISNGTY